jgi:hypothetical protein
MNHTYFIARFLTEISFRSLTEIGTRAKELAEKLILASDRERAWAASDLLLVGKSSLAELSLNLTWNIYTFSGSFRRKERAFRMTVGFRGRNCCSRDEK